MLAGALLLLHFVINLEQHFVSQRVVIIFVEPLFIENFLTFIETKTKSMKITMLGNKSQRSCFNTSHIKINKYKHAVNILSEPSLTQAHCGSNETGQ